MKKIVEMKSYLIVLAIAFYILPLFRISEDMGSVIMINFFIIPIITFFVSFFYGRNRKFNIIYPIIATLLFIPTIFIYYNTSVWFYIIIYLVIAFSGNIIGVEKRKRVK